MQNEVREDAPMAGIDIASTKEGALACVFGRFDIDSSPALRVRLLKLFEISRSGTMTIDLSGVTHIDSSGIATLVDALKVARYYDARLKLQGLQDQLRHLFEFSGVLGLFEGSSRP